MSESTPCYGGRGGRPSPLCSDAEFLRRLSIDLFGSLPSADETRRFLADPSPHKRSYLVGRLLEHPRYAVHMARTFDVMLLERRNTEGIKQEDWERYLFDSFLANKPYDQLAREILTADGTDPKTRPAVKFYLERSGDPNLLTRDVGRIFFARDLQCCQCHDHPLIEHYRQADYYGLFAFLQRGYLTLDPTNPENKRQAGLFRRKGRRGSAGHLSVGLRPQEGQARHSPKLPGETEIDEPYYPVGTEYKPTTADAAYPLPKYSRRARFADEIGKRQPRVPAEHRQSAVGSHAGTGALRAGRSRSSGQSACQPRVAQLAGRRISLDGIRHQSLPARDRADRPPISVRSSSRPTGCEGPLRQPPSGNDSNPSRSDSRRPSRSLETQIKSAEGTFAPLRKAADAVGEELTTAETKAQETKEGVRRRLGSARSRLAPTPKPANSRPRHWRTPRRRLESHSRRCRVKPPWRRGRKFRGATLPLWLRKRRSYERRRRRKPSHPRPLSVGWKANNRSLRRLRPDFQPPRIGYVAGRPPADRVIARRQTVLTRINSLKQAAAAAKSVGKLRRAASGSGNGGPRRRGGAIATAPVAAARRRPRLARLSPRERSRTRPAVLTGRCGPRQRDNHWLHRPKIEHRPGDRQAGSRVGRSRLGSRGGPGTVVRRPLPIRT